MLSSLGKGRNVAIISFCKISKFFLLILQNGFKRLIINTLRVYFNFKIHAQLLFFLLMCRFVACVSLQFCTIESCCLVSVQSDRFYLNDSYNKEKLYAYLLIIC